MLSKTFVTVTLLAAALTASASPVPASTPAPFTNFNDNKARQITGITMATLTNTANGKSYHLAIQQSGTETSTNKKQIVSKITTDSGTCLFHGARGARVTTNGAATKVVNPPQAITSVICDV